MIKFVFTKIAEKNFLKFPKDEQNRIIDKLKYLKLHEKIPPSFKKLYDFEPSTHRIRIGKLRILGILLLNGVRITS